MRAGPSAVGARYLPFLVVAAVLCLLVVLVPSKGPGDGLEGAAGNFSGEATGDNAAGSGTGTAGDVAGGAAGAGGAANQAQGGGTGGVDGVAGGTGAAANGSGTTGAMGPNAPVSGAAAFCKGMQAAPLYPLGVRCRPDFAGNNGGRTHKGVTATEIRYTWYNPPENPVLNGLLAQAGLAREIPPFCDAMLAFEKSVQKYFELSGRKLVAVDGPGSNAGSAGCDGKYKFFQSRCGSSSPDLPCLRGDGKSIGEQMNVAFVLAPRGHSVVFEELALRKVFGIGYNGSRQKFQQYAPFLWGDGLSQERVYALHSEYYCKRLAGQEPSYGGDDVKALAGGRKIGIAWPDTADGGRRALINSWLATLRKCGAEAKSYTYEADVSRAAQQAQSLVAQMRSDGITTVTWCCDPVSYAFLHEALSQNRYFPEHYILPVAAIASDVAGNTYEDAGFGDQWAHAFGISELTVNKPDDDPAYRRAYADGGGPGGKEGVPPIENESFKALHQMMQMIHSAGPGITPQTVFDGMQDLPPIAPSILTPGFDFKPPDPFVAQLDVAEVWWSPTLHSYYSDTNGAMCYVNKGARYEPGRVPTGRANLFTGNAACARLPAGT